MPELVTEADGIKGINGQPPPGTAGDVDTSDGTVAEVIEKRPSKQVTVDESQVEYYSMLAEDEDGDKDGDEEGEDTSQEYALLDYRTAKWSPRVSSPGASLFWAGVVAFLVVGIVALASLLWIRHENSQEKTEQCFIGADLDDGGALRLVRSSGETVSVALPSRAPDAALPSMAPSTRTPVRESKQEGTASTAKDGLATLADPGVAQPSEGNGCAGGQCENIPHAQTEPSVVSDAVPVGLNTQAMPALSVDTSSTTLHPDISRFPDLTCQDVPHAEWHDVKALTEQQFGQWAAGSQQLPIDDLSGFVDAVGRKLGTVMQEVDECAMGRVCMSLLAVFATQEGGGSLVGAQSIHSPLLTILLDIPWGVVVRSGWPIFGLLSQIHLLRQPGSDTPSATRPDGSQVAMTEQIKALIDYFQTLRMGLAQRRPLALATVGSDFMLKHTQLATETDVPVMPALCAMASQLLTDELENRGDEAHAFETLKHVQGFFKSEVRGIEELQATLDSAWPLYSILHAASVRLRPPKSN